MLQQFSLDWKLYRKSSVFTLLCGVIGYLFGVLLLLLILFLDESTTSSFSLGTLFGAMLTCAVSVFFQMRTYYEESMLALSMGRRRIDFIFSFFLRHGIVLLGIYLLLLLGNAGEKLLYARLFPDKGFDPIMHFLYNVPLMLAIIVGLDLLSILLGLLLCLFGQKYRIVILAIWIVLCNIPNLISRASHTDAGQRILTTLAGMPTATWYFLGLVAFLSAIIAIVRLAKKTICPLKMCHSEAF